MPSHLGMSVYKEVKGLKVLIAGGGTAGHINPGIAIAKYIKCKHNDAEVLFIGTGKGLESKLVPMEGFKIEFIRVRGIKRKISFEIFPVIKELLQGLWKTRRIIKRFKPDIVVGTGGYVCGPVVFCASVMRIPTLIHEQNAYPGLTNRILSRYADAVAMSFRDSGEYFKKAKRLLFTGNPIRPEMLENDRESARQKLGISREKRLVVVIGGSRGAEKINASVVDMLLKYYKQGDFNIYFATGELHFTSVKKQLEGMENQDINVLPYIYNTAIVYPSSDLAVCRAGAITSSELTALGIPSVMIPSPYVTANHQERNARLLEKHGAAVVIPEKDLNGSLLYQQIMNLLDNKEQLNKMAKSAKKIGITGAVDKIYSIIVELTGKRTLNGI